MNDLLALLRQLDTTRFYGSLEIKFEAGRVVVIRKTESIKPTTGNYRENRGNEHVHTNR